MTPAEFTARMEAFVDFMDSREELVRRQGSRRTNGLICQRSDLDWLSHPNGDPISGATADPRLLRLCGVCGYKDRCLEIALTEDRRYGVWGGTTPAMRKEMV